MARVVGYVLGVVVDLAPEMFAQEASGFLADIYVDAGYRRSGVGRALVEALTAWFREKGLHYFEWHVAARNEDSLAFWRSLGGREVMLRMRAELDDEVIRSGAAPAPRTKYKGRSDLRGSWAVGAFNERTTLMQIHR